MANAKFGQCDFSPGPKVALGKDPLYSSESAKPHLPSISNQLNHKTLFVCVEQVFNFKVNFKAPLIKNQLLCNVPSLCLKLLLVMSNFPNMQRNFNNPDMSRLRVPVSCWSCQVLLHQFIPLFLKGGLISECILPSDPSSMFEILSSTFLLLINLHIYFRYVGPKWKYLLILNHLYSMYKRVKDSSLRIFMIALCKGYS